MGPVSGTFRASQYVVLFECRILSPVHDGVEVQVDRLSGRQPGVEGGLVQGGQERGHDLPAKAWTAMTIARAGGKTRRVQVIDDPTATLSSYPGTLRQIAVAGLGHDEPTILITNDLTSLAKKIVERYARRMNIEQRLAESI